MPQRRNMRVYQQVHCCAEKLEIVEKGNTTAIMPAAIELGSGSGSLNVLALTLASQNTNLVAMAENELESLAGEGHNARRCLN
jgi:hypothetical protein